MNEVLKAVQRVLDAEGTPKKKAVQRVLDEAGVPPHDAKDLMDKITVQFDDMNKTGQVYSWHFRIICQECEFCAIYYADSGTLDLDIRRRVKSPNREAHIVHEVGFPTDTGEPVK